MAELLNKIKWLKLTQFPTNIPLPTPIKFILLMYLQFLIKLEYQGFLGRFGPWKVELCPI